MLPLTSKDSVKSDDFKPSIRFKARVLEWARWVWRLICAQCSRAEISAKHVSLRNFRPSQSNLCRYWIKESVLFLDAESVLCVCGAFVWHMDKQVGMSLPFAYMYIKITVSYTYFVRNNINETKQALC